MFGYFDLCKIISGCIVEATMLQSICPWPMSRFTAALCTPTPSTSTNHTSLLPFLPACRATWKWHRFVPGRNLQLVRNWSLGIDTQLPVTQWRTRSERLKPAHVHTLPFLPCFTPHSLAALPGVTTQINYLCHALASGSAFGETQTRVIKY